MFTELYIEALFADDDLANHVRELWNAILSVDTSSLIG
jgi:hypothetical protein